MTVKRRIPLLLSIILVFLRISLNAQTSADITGTWIGTIGVPLSSDLVAEYSFTQNGMIIEGRLTTLNANGKDSVVSEFRGTVKGNDYHFKGTKFLYRKLTGCLATSDLTYSVENGKETLTGRWHGELSLKLNVCPAAWAGKINLVRKKPETIASNVKPVETAHEPANSGNVETIKSGDEEGNALVTALGARKYYALIIGIDNYKDHNIQHLDHPIADATSLKNIITKYYTFDPDNIVFLVNPTRTEIIDAFDKLSRKITDRDQLLIFYAGHGIWDEQLNQGYWLPSDASIDSKAQWLSNGTIRDYIGGIKSKHTLLITDACFSGSIFKERGVEFNNSKAILQMYKLPSRKAMTSGTLKTVPDKSVFVKYLIKDLVTNEKPLLSAEELFRTFKIAVINNSPNGQVPQYGPISQAGDEGGDFIFLRRRE